MNDYHPIFNNKVDEIRFVNQTFGLKIKEKKQKLTREEFVEYLQYQHVELKQLFYEILEYEQTTQMLHSEFELIKTEFNKLSKNYGVLSLLFQEFSVPYNKDLDEFFSLSSFKEEKNKKKSFSGDDKLYRELRELLPSFSDFHQKTSYLKEQVYTSETFYFENKTHSKKEIDLMDETYSAIFSKNGFKIWNDMFETFKITESSRTDIRFMFEVMKSEDFIHKSVRQVDILRWIDSKYQLTIEKPKFHDWKKDIIRLAAYDLAKIRVLNIPQKDT